MESSGYVQVMNPSPYWIDYDPHPFAVEKGSVTYTFPYGSWTRTSEPIFTTTYHFQILCPGCHASLNASVHGLAYSPQWCPFCGRPIEAKDLGFIGGQSTSLADGLYRVNNGIAKKLE